MITAMTNQNEVYIPDFLFQTALLLQGMVYICLQCTFVYNLESRK